MWDKMGFDGSAHRARSLQDLRVWVDRKTRTPLKEPQTLRRHIERTEGSAKPGLSAEQNSGSYKDPTPPPGDRWGTTSIQLLPRSRMEQCL